MYTLTRREQWRYAPQTAAVRTARWPTLVTLVAATLMLLVGLPVYFGLGFAVVALAMIGLLAGVSGFNDDAYRVRFFSDGTFDVEINERPGFSSAFHRVQDVRRIRGVGRSLCVVGQDEVVVPDRCLPAGGAEWIDEMAGWGSGRRASIESQQYLEYSADPLTAGPFGLDARAVGCLGPPLIGFGALIGVALGTATGGTILSIPSWAFQAAFVPLLLMAFLAAIGAKLARSPRRSMIRMLPGGVHFSSPGDDSSVPYSLVSDVQLHRAGVSFRKDRSRCWLPTHAFRDESHRRQFADELQRRATAAGTPG